MEILSKLLFKNKNVLTITTEEFINMLPSLSLNDIEVIIELTWWIKHKDHPSFKDMAKPILENLQKREVNEEIDFKNGGIEYSNLLLKNIKEYDVDPQLSDAIRLELEIRQTLNS